MSIETTQEITREEAIRMVMEAFAAKIAALNTMSDSDLEDLLYSLTRDTNYFDNFRITGQ
jgi:hypothetical protein